MEPSATDLERMLESARAVRAHAYAPYSGYRVGAALLADSGRVYLGANVENASYGATICAERAAVGAAVAAGERRWLAIAVYADGAKPPLPCGICRQVLSELGQGALVLSVSSGGARRLLPLADLLPEAFTGEALDKHA
ncbi:MAG: cytidine deaminase [Chloroflexota bacterium]